MGHYDEQRNNKYEREIKKGVTVDVYDVLNAYRTDSPELDHAIKKLLMSGQRGHKDQVTDLKEAIQAIERKIDRLKDDTPKGGWVTCEMETIKPYKKHGYSGFTKGEIQSLIKSGWKWIAVDQISCMYVYLDEPVKYRSIWRGACMRLHLSSIQYSGNWEKSPTKLEDLL